MKKIVIVAFAIISLFVFPIKSFAGGYFAIGGGAGGQSGAPNLTFEVGGVSTSKNHNRLLSIGFGFVFNADDVPTGTLEYPVPHSDYVNLGTRQKGNEYAFFGKYGLEIIKGKGLFLFVLGGLSAAEEIELARSNVTGWYYEQSSSSKVNGMFGGGISYFPLNNRLSFQVEYDNRRGVTAGVGVRW